MCIKGHLHLRGEQSAKVAENEHVQFSYTQRKAEQNWLNSCKGQETLLASNVASAMGVKHRNVVSNKEGW